MSFGLLSRACQDIASGLTCLWMRRIRIRATCNLRLRSPCSWWIRLRPPRSWSLRLRPPIHGSSGAPFIKTNLTAPNDVLLVLSISWHSCLTHAYLILLCVRKAAMETQQAAIEAEQQRHEDMYKEVRPHTAFRTSPKWHSNLPLLFSLYLSS